MRYILTILFAFTFLFSFAQNKATIVGAIVDGVTNEAVEFATVYEKGTGNATESDFQGNFRIEVKAGKAITLVFSRLGYKESEIEVTPTRKSSTRRLNISMAPQDSDVEIIVTGDKIENTGMIREEVTELKLLPTATGNLESVLPHIALGTNSGTGGELSSQYNVRGGNYDENLVYVNDFEIYRPQLIRSGQQEGLTFPNIDLIRDLSFSSGGFQAKYGDKLSSVLDIKYKRPDSLRSSVGLSFLGGSAHVEGSISSKKDNYKKFRYLMGARYKTTRYLLGTLDVRGEYTPNFADVQGYFTYDINRDLQIGLIGNYNRSEYQFVPTERSTGLGLIDFALQLTSVFEGQEVDDFSTYMSGVSLTYLPDRDRNPFYLKLLASTYQSDENERFDILGFYSLGQVESDLGSDDLGEVVAVLGTGTQHQFVRNYLTSNVTNVQHKGGLELNIEHDDPSTSSNHFINWGVKYQHEIINDQINEWERLDSAGYSLNYDDTEVLVRNVLKTENNLSSDRFTAYVQDTYSLSKDSISELKLTAGIRASYWSLNNEFFVSPRMQLLYKPLKWKSDITFRFASGIYNQAPFYRELRRPNGTINEDLLSQKSIHFVGGITYDFQLGKLSPKDFRIIMEAYYKVLDDLVSYEVDNVRIRYSGENDATGYVAGLDFRMNGEFVPGAESWVNLSFLRARESLNGITHLKREIGDSTAQVVNTVPRPTDRFMTLSMFFQDYLPKNKNFKMHLNFTVGTGLPFGLLGNNREFRNTYRFETYHRVDIGFSILLWDQAWRFRKTKHPLRFSKSTWMSLEVFNLMEVSNVASNTWIKTIYNTQYAIPNFLTSRRINLRLKMDF